MNRVMLIGNITRDIELKRIPSGKAVVDLGLAVNDKYKDVDGNLIENTLFVDVTVWGRNAETCNEFLKKGSKVAVEGKLKLDSWENSEGEKRTKIRVTADRVEFIGGKPAGKPKAETAVVSAAGSGTETDQDIPFNPNLL